jgi:hypothetical protein
VTLEVAASSTLGRGISRVDFTVDGVAVGTATASPFSVTWDTTGLAAKTYSVVATAYDDGSPAKSGTATLAVKVKASVVRTQITAPTAGNRTVTQGAAVVISATASAPLGIASVAFTANGLPIGTATAPVAGAYSVTWPTASLTPGAYTIVATASDNAAPAQTGSATIQIQVDAATSLLPTVQITAPVAGAAVSWNMIVRVNAQAQAPGATISNIQVMFGTQTKTLAGKGTATLSGNVTFDTTAFADGSHDLTAIATDSANRQSAATLTVTVANNVSPPPPPWH